MWRGGGGGFFWEILTKNSDKYLFSASFVKAGKYLTVSYHRISESWGVYFNSAKVVPTYFWKHHFLSDVHCCYAIQGKSITLLKNYTLNFITLHDSRYITFFVNIVEICHGIINFLLQLTRWGGGKCQRRFQPSRTSLLFKQYLRNFATFAKIY